jgi:RING finger/CCCH-type zinc finger protein
MNSLLSCQICMNGYDRGHRLPLTLKCGHSLCKECADALIKKNNRKCPFDNTLFEARTVENLGRNFSLLDLLDA